MFRRYLPGVHVSERSTESCLMLELARARPTSPDCLCLRQFAAAVPDWTRIVRWALDHGTGGLLCRHLIDDAPDLLSPDLRQAADLYLDRGRARHARALEELAQVLRALEVAGVLAIPMKGPTLAEQAYPEPALRPYADLDLLIEQADIAPTMRTLADLGYRSQAMEHLRDRRLAAYQAYNGQDILFADNRLPVEPHWALAPRTFAADLDLGAMRARSVPTEPGSSRRRLSAEDTLLVAVLHGCKEGWPRLIWVCDVDAIVHASPGLDWGAVADRARAAGLSRALRVAVGLSRSLLGTPLPEQIETAIAADAVATRLIRHIGTRLIPPRLADAPEPARSVFRLSLESLVMRERATDQVRYLLRTATTPRVPHFHAVDLPDRLDFAYPLVKLAHDYVALPVWLAGKTIVASVRAAIRGRARNAKPRNTKP
jgi:hypothetical protein